MVEIALLDTSDSNRAFLIHELAQLTFRMAVGSDASDAEMHPADGAERP